MADTTLNHGTQGQRDALVLDISWELDKVARTLVDIIPLQEDQLHFLVRTIAGRMLRLTGVLMEVGSQSGDVVALERVVSLTKGSQG